MASVKIGIVGCGNISGNYLTHARKFPVLEVAALADLAVDRARAKAAEFGVPKAGTVDDLLADPAIQIVVNLTIPAAHFEVGMKVLAAGKHLYNEKPLAGDPAQGAKLLDEARKRGLRVGGAPDTFLGAAHQTARKLIDDGAIGRPVAAVAFMMGRGHESWHPDPEFYYKKGGGPMFDMGPYYLTALIQMLGPIKRVAGIASIAVPRRTVTSQPRYGTAISVETPDHVTGSIEFAGGAVASIVTSFACAHSTHDRANPITIFGENGTLAVPDPNNFDGTVKLCRGIQRGASWEDVPPTHTRDYGRSAGVADLAAAIQGNRPHRCSAEQCFAVLQTMQAFLDSSAQGKAIAITTPHDRPKALPAGLPLGQLD